MNRCRLGCACLALTVVFACLPALRAAAAADPNPDEVNAMLKQLIQDLAQARADNEALAAQLKASRATAAALDHQNRELDDTNRRLRAVLRDLAERGFPVYEVLGTNPAGGAGTAAAKLPPEVATRLNQLLDQLADAPNPRENHPEDWDWSPPAQTARDEIVKLGAPAVDPLLSLAARHANPVVKMRAGAIVLQIRQQSQAMVSAKVLDVGDRNDLVSIGLGENQGVAVGQTFLLLRGSTYVGQAKVTRVWGDLCVAQSVDHAENAQVGDQALALVDRAKLPAKPDTAPGVTPTTPGGLLGPNNPLPEPPKPVGGLLSPTPPEPAPTVNPPPQVDPAPAPQPLPAPEPATPALPRPPEPVAP